MQNCRYNRKSLKVLGTVGEPINPEAWLWYYHTVGDERCVIVDTYWQTETVSSHTPIWLVVYSLSSICARKTQCITELHPDNFINAWQLLVVYHQWYIDLYFIWLHRNYEGSVTEHKSSLVHANRDSFWNFLKCLLNISLLKVFYSHPWFSSYYLLVTYFL